MSSKDASATRPTLSARHNAMLAEMGVNVWWAETPSVAAPTQPTPRQPGQASVTSPARSPSAAAPPRPTAPAPAPVPIPEATRSAVVVRPAEWPDLPSLEAAIRDCSACDLCQTRRQAVPGSGDAAPDWLLVGEAPGEEEDAQGLPFVGRAGQLLDSMLQAMHLERAQRVHIANVLKCRPPRNRNPDPLELQRCAPFLLRQIELLQPRLLLALGRFAAHGLLQHVPGIDVEQLLATPLGRLRGRVHHIEVGGRRWPVVVSYHPAYLLRSPADKAKAWADLCLAMDTMDSLPPRGGAD